MRSLAQNLYESGLSNKDSDDVRNYSVSQDKVLRALCSSLPCTKEHRCKTRTGDSTKMAWKLNQPKNQGKCVDCGMFVLWKWVNK